MNFFKRFFYKIKLAIIKKKYRLSEVELEKKRCENCKYFCSTVYYGYCEKGNGQIEKPWNLVCDLFEYKNLYKILNSIKTNIREVSNETKN